MSGRAYAERPTRAHFAPAALGLALVVAALATRRLADPDLGWHLATGRSIWSHGRIPKVDDIAFLHAPIRYTVAVSDVLFYLVARAFGPLGLEVLAGVIAAALGVVLFLHGGRGPAALFAAALALAGMNAWVALSAAELSYLLLATTLFLLDVHRRAVGARRGTVALAALAPLLFVWANAHGFAALGAAAALGYAAYRVVARLARGRLGDALPPEDGADAGTTALFVAAAIGAACISTAGPRLFLGAYRFDEELSNVTEWAPTTLALLVHEEPVALVVAALGVLSLLAGRDGAAHGASAARRIPSLFDAGAIVGALAVLFHTTRMIPVAIVVITPIAARRLAWLVPSSRLVVVAAALATLIPGAVMLIAPKGTLGVGFDATILPVAATRWIERADPPGRMWNFWPFGGYLAWELGPEREVFVDGRNTLAHDRSTIVRANESVVDRDAFERLADELDMQWAISSASVRDPSSGAGVAASPRWTMVYLDDVAAVYVRRSGPAARLVEHGYRIVRHTMPPGAMLTIAMRGGAPAAALAHDADLAVEQAPASTRSAFLGACGAIAARDDAKLASAIDRLVTLGADRALVDALRAARAAAP